MTLSLSPHTDKSTGETVLYFGCRNQNEDFIYEDELTNYKEEGVLSSLYLAFSRDQVGVM